MKGVETTTPPLLLPLQGLLLNIRFMLIKLFTVYFSYISKLLYI